MLISEVKSLFSSLKGIEQFDTGDKNYNDILPKRVGELIVYGYPIGDNAISFKYGIKTKKVLRIDIITDYYEW